MGLVASLAHVVDGCVRSDCDVGTVYVNELWTFWQGVYGSLSAADQATYGAKVNAIVGTFNIYQNEPWYQQWDPFGSYCCQLAAVGTQAHALLTEITEAAGTTILPGAIDPSTNTVVDVIDQAAKKAAAAAGDALTSILSAAKWAALAAAIGVGGYVAFEGYTTIRRGLREDSGRSSQPAAALTGPRRRMRP